MRKRDNKPAALDHVLYEMVMLVNSLSMLSRPSLPAVESSGWLEVFAVHSRNLNEFFGDMGDGGGHMKPSHFFPTWNHSYTLNKDLIRRANSQVAHLTYDRETPEQKTSWPLHPFFSALKEPCIDFLRKANADSELMAYKNNQARTTELLEALSKREHSQWVGSQANIAPVNVTMSFSRGPNRSLDTTDI